MRPACGRRAPRIVAKMPRWRSFSSLSCLCPKRFRSISFPSRFRNEREPYCPNDRRSFESYAAHQNKGNPKLSIRKTVTTQLQSYYAPRLPGRGASFPPLTPLLPPVGFSPLFAMAYCNEEIPGTKNTSGVQALRAPRVHRALRHGDG